MALDAPQFDSVRPRLAGAAGTVLAHWSNASRATRYRVFKQIDGVDASTSTSTPSPTATPR